MALTRGARGKLPCPICIVPADQLSDVLTAHPLRTAQKIQEIINEANGLNITQREALLSAHGIRNVKVSLDPRT